MEQRVQRKTNPVLKDVIRQCEEAARKNDAAIWRDVADALKNANREQVEVNLSHIERVAEDGDNIVVPGKVLGSGRLSKNVVVAAFQFTQSALDAINDAGEATYIEALVEENPDGTDIRLIR